MKFKEGDVIFINSIKDNNDFWCKSWYTGLIGFPTKIVLTDRQGVQYVTHPELDMIPLRTNCIDFDVIKDIEVEGHRDLKDKQKSKNIERSLNFFKTKLKESEEKPSLTKSQEKLVNILNKFQSGDINSSYIGNALGSVSKFIDLLERQNLIGYLDPLNSVWEDYENYLLYKKVESDPSYVWTVVNSLSDILKVGDTYYFDTTGEELAGFFNTGRGDISQSTIAELIEGSYDIDSWDVTDDEYRDIYDELTPKNKKLVDDRIREELKKMGTIDSYTNELETISNEQGRDDVELTDEAITRILEDEKTMSYLINQVLDEIRNDLYSVYSSCYSTTLTDSWYNDIMSKLTGEVIDNTMFEEYSFKKNVYNNKTGKSEPRTLYARRYPVTNCVYNLVKDWIYEYKESHWSDDIINYHGSYANLMGAAISSGLRNDMNVPRLDDYPDNREMAECINEYIGDYF